MLCAWSCKAWSDLIKRTQCAQATLGTLGPRAASGCVHCSDSFELNMNTDAGFASPAQSHLGCSGVTGSISDATEAVGQRRLCCRHISAADAVAVLAADAKSSNPLLSMPCSGPCAGSCCSTRRSHHVGSCAHGSPGLLHRPKRKGTHVRRSCFPGLSPAVTSGAAVRPRTANRQRPRAAHCCLGLMILHAAVFI